MSITDELRMYVQDWRDTPSLMDDLDRGDVDGMLEDFIRIADRIDVEYAAYRAAVDAMLKEYVKLPVDADGVPIRVGDNVAEGDDEFEVRALSLYDKDSWDVLDRLGVSFSPLLLRHVQHDSWERIMDDAEKLARGDNAAVMELVERCRRLAGEGA